MSRLNKIYTQLSEAQSKVRKAKLNKKGKEVKLNVVQEIENSRDFLRDAVSDVAYMVDDYLPKVEKQLFDIRRDLDNFIVNSTGSSIEDAYEQLQDALTLLDDKARDLGIDPNEIYDEFKDAEDDLSNAEGYINQYADMEKEYELVFTLTNLK